MDWDLLPTPNPNEDAIRIWVDKGTALGMQGRYAEGVTTLAAFDLSSAPVSEGQDDWIFTKKVGPDNTGRLGFIFGKAKTDAEKYTPWNENDPEQHNQNKYWPNTMRRWRAAPDPTRAFERFDPNGITIYEMKWDADYDLQPYYDGPTDFERLWYLAPTPFELKKTVKLQTVSFGWALPGDGMEPTRMLIAQRIRRPNRVLGPGVISSTTFEPTFPNGWTRHLAFTDQEKIESGLWSMYEDYAIPPSQVNTIKDR